MGLPLEEEKKGKKGVDLVLVLCMWLVLVLVVEVVGCSRELVLEEMECLPNAKPVRAAGV